LPGVFDLLVDKKNRHAPDRMSDKDYVSTDSKSGVLVLGDVWHRTPPLEDGETRLFVLIELIP